MIPELQRQRWELIQKLEKRLARMDNALIEMWKDGKRDPHLLDENLAVRDKLKAVKAAYDLGQTLACAGGMP
jgi:hypothetical protein